MRAEPPARPALARFICFVPVPFTFNQDSIETYEKENENENEK